MKNLINYFKRLNEALPVLILTILIYGLIVLLAGVWFFDDKVKYVVGLAIGLAQAIFLSINMASSLMGVAEAGQMSKKGQTIVALKSVLRYIIVVIITFLMCYFDWGYIGTWFVGVMGLKVAAWMQLLIHKGIAKKGGIKA